MNGRQTEAALKWSVDERCLIASINPREILLPLRYKKRMEEYSKSVIDTFYAQQFSGNSSSDRKSKCWFEISLFLLRFHSPVDVRRRTNQFNRFFIWFAFAERKEQFLMKEKYEKFPNRFFPPTMMMMKIKEKLMKSLLWIAGAVGGWCGFDFRTSSVECLVLIIFLIYSKTFFRNSSTADSFLWSDG